MVLCPSVIAREYRSARPLHHSYRRNGGHRVKARGCGDESGDGVEGDGAGGGVAVDAAVDNQVERGLAVDDDPVVGVFLADGGLELQVDDAVLVGVAAGDLADAGDRAA